MVFHPSTVLRTFALVSFSSIIAHGLSRMNLLVITNIYPPQELGGYGRCIYDFVNSLASLNHSVDVLTSDAPYLLVNSEVSYFSSSLKPKPSVFLSP